MKLITNNENKCVFASLAMLIVEDINMVEGWLKHYLPDATFPPPYDELPRVPDMISICAWLLGRNIALTPFPFDPQCTPHPSCPAKAVYENPQGVFNARLALGPGLIEGVVNGDRGHMVAWNGTTIYDPRGYCYSLNVSWKFDFEPAQFWLATACQ